MLGQSIRSFNHLYRIINKQNPKPVNGYRILSISNNGLSVTDCYVFPLVSKSNAEFKDLLLLTGNPFRPWSGMHHQNFIEKYGSEYDIPEETLQKISKLEQRGFVHELCLVTTDDSGTPHLRACIGLNNYSFLLPDDMEAKFNEFKEKNKKVVNQVCNKYVGSGDPKMLFYYMMSNGNPVFFGWIAKMVAKYNVSLFALLHLMSFNDECDKLVSQLSVKNLVAISSCEECLKALRESFVLRANVTARKIVNTFNTKQKHLLKNELHNPEVVMTLNNFSRLSLKKRNNFIRKVSTIEDSAEIIRLLRYLCTNTHFKWNQILFHDFIKNSEGLKCEIVYTRPGITVLRIYDFETVKRLAKTTNWCISKNKTYWEQYVGRYDNTVYDVFADEQPDFAFREPVRLGEAFGGLVHQGNGCGIENFEMLEQLKEQAKKEIDDISICMFHSDDPDEKSKQFKEFIRQEIYAETEREKEHNVVSQYMVFDFSEKEDGQYSIVGITSKKRGGITHAHDFANGNMMLKEYEQLRLGFIDWDSFFEENKKQTANIRPKIDEFLEERRLNKDIFTCMDGYNRFDWNRESLFKFIDQYIDDDEYDILYDNNGIVLLSSSNLRFGLLTNKIKEFERFISNHDCDNIFWLIDLNKSGSDDDRILFWLLSDCRKRTIITADTVNANMRSHSRRESSFRTFNEMLDTFDLPYDIIRRPNIPANKAIEFLREGSFDLFLKVFKEESFNDKEIEKITSALNAYLRRNGFGKSLLNVIRKLKSVRSLDKIIGHKDAKHLLTSYYNTNIGNLIEPYGSKLPDDYIEVIGDKKTLKKYYDVINETNNNDPDSPFSRFLIVSEEVVFQTYILIKLYEELSHVVTADDLIGAIVNGIFARYDHSLYEMSNYITKFITYFKDSWVPGKSALLWVLLFDLPNEIVDWIVEMCFKDQQVSTHTITRFINDMMTQCSNGRLCQDRKNEIVDAMRRGLEEHGHKEILLKFLDEQEENYFKEKAR